MLEFVLAFWAVGGLVAMALGLPLTLPKSRRRLGTRLIFSGLGIFVLSAVALSSTQGAAVRGDGWESVADRDAAHSEGIEDPVEWAQFKAWREEEDQQARLAADAEAERLAQEAASRQREEERDRRAAAAAERREAELAEEETCLRTLACAGERASSLAITTQCERLLPSLVRYSFEFNDGWLEPKFSHYRWRDQSAGIVTIIGGRARVQNGFGAWLPVVYECDVDVAQERIVDARVEEGRI